MPLAGGFLADAAAVERERLYPLPAHVCDECGLVQILEVIDPNILFQDYSFSSSTVGPLVEHFARYAEWLKATLSPETVVEFGCNDGVLLKPLERLGVRAYGVDISENITAAARDQGLQVATGKFDAAMAARLRDEYGAVDVVTGSNAFAHNDVPSEILEAAAAVLKPGGHLCLEVMYAGDLLEQLQWDTLYHEHLTFYSLGTLRPLLERHGFTIRRAERVPMHGGSLRIAAQFGASDGNTEAVDAIDSYESAVKLNAPTTWMDFGSKIGRKIGIVRDVLGDLAQKRRIWGYGAAGKATLWMNACGMNYLEAVVDASPLRAGKLMPGTHTPIVFPAELRKSNPDYIFVSAWNYADVIRAKESWFGGTWITPLPDLRLF